MDKHQTRFCCASTQPLPDQRQQEATRLTVPTLAAFIGKIFSRTLVTGLKWLIRLYQLVLSPYVGMHCRFHPSCSNYALQALDRHGAIIGMGLAVRRVLRCQPWGASGYDPVPGKQIKYPHG